MLTPRDTFIFSIAKDLDDGHINERDFTWVRDLHSFVGTVTYKQVKKKWEVKVTAKDMLTRGAELKSHGFYGKLITT